VFYLLGDLQDLKDVELRLHAGSSRQNLSDIPQETPPLSL
jgi:hypothetical protein